MVLKKAIFCLLTLLAFTVPMNSFSAERKSQNRRAKSCTTRLLLCLGVIACATPSVSAADIYSATLYRDPAMLPTEPADDVVDYHCRLERDAQGRKAYVCKANGNKKLGDEEFPETVRVPRT